MIKFENTEVMGWEHAIRGMRNPMNSWNKSDSFVCSESEKDCREGCPQEGNCMIFDHNDHFIVGKNDYDLMKRLRHSGTDHRKFMRMLTVYVDITAPLYWWKEFDTYKVGTVANSCSTMHKIHAKPFVVEDFSCEELYFGTDDDLKAHYKHFTLQIDSLNNLRDLFLKTKDKKYWYAMIQMLPSSYNQRRTVQMNYEVLANIYKSRKNHKLDEWRVDTPTQNSFCDWIKTLPYSEFITGEFNEEE